MPSQRAFVLAALLLPGSAFSTTNTSASGHIFIYSTTTGAQCCAVIGLIVEIEFWYTKSIEVTVATVLTQFLKYDNTLVTTSTTVFANYSKTTYGLYEATLPGIPTDIITLPGDYLEQITYLEYGSVLTAIDGHLIPSPTSVANYPFVEVDFWSSTPGTPCSIGGVDFLSTTTIEASYYYAYPPNVTLTMGEQFFTVAQGLLDYLSANKAAYNVGACDVFLPGFGDGLPTVHISVNQLTVQASTTIYAAGNPTTAAQTPYITRQTATAANAPYPTSTQPSTSNPDLSISTASTGYIIGTQTVLPGSQIIYSGTTISLSPSGTALVINGVTTSLPAPPASSASTPSNLVLPSIATTVSAGFVYGSQTVLPGSEITVSGTTVSLAPSGTAIIINGITSVLTTGCAACTGASSSAPCVVLSSSAVGRWGVDVLAAMGGMMLAIFGVVVL